MKYWILITAILLSFSSTAQVSQEDSVYLDNVEKQGRIMAELLVAKDYKAFVKFTHPQVIKMLRGEEKMVEVLKESMETMEADGFSIVNCTISRPLKIIQFKTELQCTVPQTLEMKTPEGRMVTKSTLIGISGDKGANWVFIDTQGKELKILQARFPNLSPELVIPQKEDPVIYK